MGKNAFKFIQFLTNKVEFRKQFINRLMFSQLVGEGKATWNNNTQ